MAKNKYEYCISAQKLYKFKVIDRVSGKVIAKNFHDFCKCGMMTQPGALMQVKDADKDFLFIVEEK